ncbi:MAG: hypothetical protein HY658_04890, partial [Actinobacteria bacterium]|nr:hypothetical protein [Actinomycetota bacterium]
MELAILVLAQLVLDGTAAFAGSCSNAEQIFIRAAQSPSDSSPVYAYGTRSRITMRNRDLDPACPAAYPPDSTGFYGAVSLSTAHINRGITGSYAGYQVEIGWVEVWEGNDTSGQGAGLKDWYVFSEKQANWDIKDITTQLSFNLDPGNDDWWRASAVAKPNGTTDWKLAVNFLIGQGWVDFKTYNTEWDFGVPMGETERKGTDTGMMDYQYNLDL